MELVDGVVAGGEQVLDGVWESFLFACSALERLKEDILSFQGIIELKSQGFISECLLKSYLTGGELRGFLEDFTVKVR